MADQLPLSSLPNSSPAPSLPLSSLPFSKNSTLTSSYEFDNLNDFLSTSFPVIDQFLLYLKHRLRKTPLTEPENANFIPKQFPPEDEEDEEEKEKLLVEKQRIEQEEKELTQKVLATVVSSSYCVCCFLVWFCFSFFQFGKLRETDQPDQILTHKVSSLFGLCIVYLSWCGFSLFRLLETKDTNSYRMSVLSANFIIPCLFQTVLCDLALFPVWAIYSFSCVFVSLVWWPKISDFILIVWLVIHAVLIPSYFRVQGIELSYEFVLCLVSVCLFVLIAYYSAQQLFSRLILCGQQLSTVQSELQNAKVPPKTVFGQPLPEYNPLPPSTGVSASFSSSVSTTPATPSSTQTPTTSSPPGSPSPASSSVTSPIRTGLIEDVETNRDSPSSERRGSPPQPSRTRTGSTAGPVTKNPLSSSTSNPLITVTPSTAPDFSLDRIIRLLTVLKTNPEYSGNDSDVDNVLRTLMSKEARALFSPSLTKNPAVEIEDKVTRSVVYYHTNQRRLRFSTPSTPSSPTSPSGGSAKRLKLRYSKGLTECLSRIDEWRFDVFELYHLTKGRPLFYLAWTIFERRQLLTKFNIDPQKLRNFLTGLEKGYHQDNPYHNNIHACDVLQSLNFFITSGGVSSYLMDVDLFAAYVSAMIHDYDHPGKNNAFMINSQSALSLTYNDKSVLENYHCSEAFKLLRDPKCDIFSGVSSEQRRELRDLIINMVLATDFGEHMSFLAKFKARKALGPLDPLKQEDRHMLLYFSIKCADLGHTAKDFDLHLNWTERISEEFFNQGDEEKKMGLPVSPFMDRAQANVAKSQAGFLNYLVLPLYKEYTELFEGCSVCLTQLHANLEHWKQCESIPPTSDYSVYATKREKPKDPEKTNSKPDEVSPSTLEPEFRSLRMSAQKLDIKFDLTEEDHSLFEEEEDDDDAEEQMETATEHHEEHQ